MHCSVTTVAKALTPGCDQNEGPCFSVLLSQQHLWRHSGTCLGLVCTAYTKITGQPCPAAGKVGWGGQCQFIIFLGWTVSICNLSRVDSVNL